MGKAALRDERASDAVIRVSGFHKRYNRSPAVQDVTLEVKPGEIYGIIGPDGAGKSSLMKAVAGVLSFEGGEVEVFGVGIASERTAEKVKQRIGFMPQGLGLNLYPELSVEENVDFFGRLRLVPGDLLNKRKKRLLAITRLSPFSDRPMKNLSGGMKQKLGLVCTLIHEPALVILDEPTTGVDPVSRRDFWTILAELLLERGITALVSTAYMDEASRFHRMSLLLGGRVLAQGGPEEIEALASGAVVECRPEGQMEALTALKGRFHQVEAFGPRLRVFLEGVAGGEAPEKVAEALPGIVLHEIRVQTPDLDDIFVALMRKQGMVTEEEEMPPSFPHSKGLSPLSGVAIEARDLVRDFGNFRAVNKVSFSVSRGEIFGLVGANGAGKTTVIKMLAGIIPPTSGICQVAGADMRRASLEIKQRIGYMSQVFSLYQDLTVADNIRLYAGIYGLTKQDVRDRMKWVISMAGLDGYEHMLAGRLPMGVRQRLALGCALVHRPEILFLDEPTSGVDPMGRRRFWEILQRISREEGVAILLSTHYMREAEHCDHLALMHGGRIVTDASPAELKSRLAEEAGLLLELSTEDPLPAIKLLEAEGFAGIALFGKKIRLLASAPSEAEKRISSVLKREGIGLLGIREQPLSMEDVFVYRILSLERERSAGT